MKTTIEMPDDLFRKAKALAALRGQSMKQWLTDLLRKEIGDTSTAGAAAPSRQKGQKAKADAFKRELDLLATQVSKKWKGPQNAVAAIREQRRG